VEVRFIDIVSLGKANQMGAWIAPLEAEVPWTFLNRGPLPAKPPINASGLMICEPRLPQRIAETMLAELLSLFIKNKSRP
jgi:hypothetical protein